jgi:hypothetical protein
MKIYAIDIDLHGKNAGVHKPLWFNSGKMTSANRQSRAIKDAQTMFPRDFVRVRLLSGNYLSP